MGFRLRCPKLFVSWTAKLTQKMKRRVLISSSQAGPSNSTNSSHFFVGKFLSGEKNNNNQCLGWKCNWQHHNNQESNSVSQRNRLKKASVNSLYHMGKEILLHSAYHRFYKSLIERSFDLQCAFLWFSFPPPRQKSIFNEKLDPSACIVVQLKGVSTALL